MAEQASEKVGLAEVLDVAENGAIPVTGEGDAKMLGFLLRDGECTADISESTFSVWYSWLPRGFPSRYDICLAPGIIRRLMELGGVRRIASEATFQVGPATTGTGRYVFEVQRKWLRIKCNEERIIIRVRDERKGLDRNLGQFDQIVKCERCNGILRTAFAKQCLHCGYDWHS